MSAEGRRLAAAIGAAAARLATTSDTPRLDAELLMAHALGETREAMLLGGLDRHSPPFVPSGVEDRAEALPGSGAATSSGTNGVGAHLTLSSLAALPANRLPTSPVRALSGR